jgi:hypothetical protein
MKAVDWEIIKADYLTHRDVGMAALAKRYRMRERTLREVAERDHWTEQREAHSAEVARQALVQSASEQAAELADFDSDCLRCAKLAVGRFTAMLATHEKPHELSALVGALRDAQAVGRMSLGAPTETVQQIPPDEDVDSAHARAYQAMLDAEDDPALQ